MIYAINEPIPYTAAPATPGYVIGDHSVAWSFGDGTSGSGLSTTKTWATSGVKSVTAVATNLKTGGTASASKSVNIASIWVSEGFSLPSWDGIFIGAHAIELSPGMVLLIGSRLDNNDSIGNSCYIYDSINHTLTSTGKIPSSRIKTAGFASTRLQNGDVIIDGGFASGSAINPGDKLAYRYSKTTGIWSRIADRNYPNEYGNQRTSVLLPNGKVFSANCQSTYGGYDEIYDPILDTWSAISPSRSGGAFNAPSVCLMSNGNVFRGPGNSDTSNKCNSFNPITGTWTPLSNCPFINAIVVNVGQGKLLAIAKGDNPPCSIYDPISNIWSSTTSPTINANGSNISAYTLSDGRVVIYSGISTSVLMYQPISGLWVNYPSMNLSHLDAAMISTNNSLCVFGSSAGGTTLEYLR